MCLEGVQTRGQSQGHPRRHNEINLSLRCTVATSRRDNNAFNFGLPTILRLCIGAVIAGWLLAHSGCSLAAFPQHEEGGMRRRRGREGSVGVDDDGVNHTVGLSQTTDNRTSNHNSSN